MNAKALEAMSALCSAFNNLAMAEQEVVQAEHTKAVGAGIPDAGYMRRRLLGCATSDFSYASSLFEEAAARQEVVEG